jgi:ribonuclease HI
MYTAKDWLLLLDMCSKEQRCLIMLLLWHAWHVHNCITRDTGQVPVLVSVGFLLSYRESLESAGLALSHDSKGKQEVQKDGQAAAHIDRVPGLARRWEPPQEGWAKTNVDGSYLESGDAGVDAVVRDKNGIMIFKAWKFVGKCSNAPKAEVLACIEGLCWVHHRGLSHIIIELDCAIIISPRESSNGQVGGWPNHSGGKRTDSADDRSEVLPRACLVGMRTKKENLKSATVPVTSNLTAYAWSTKCR